MITLDLIGHGKSQDIKKNDSINKTAEYILKILEVEKIDKVHLIGVSIGALLIQDFANKYPQKVASLCSVGGYDINNFDKQMQKENRGEQIKMMIKAIFSIKWFAKSNKLISAITQSAQEKFYQMNIRFKRRNFRHFAGLQKLVNCHETVPRNYPLMIACGDSDIPMAITVAKQWHNNEPKSKLVIFDNAGHLVNMDTPNAFNNTLNDFLTGKL